MGDCINFMNQKAIDEIVREHNKQLGEQLYQEGHNCCVECRDSAFPIHLPESQAVQLLQTVTGGRFHRICYKPQLEARVFNRDSYGIWDNVKGAWVKGLFKSALTRDTLPSINRLLERLRVDN